MREIVFCVQPSGFPVLEEGVVLETTSLVRVSPSAQNLCRLNDPSFNAPVNRQDRGQY